MWEPAVTDFIVDPEYLADRGWMRWAREACWLQLEALANTDEDATKAIQLAFDLGMVRFPSGTYSVSGPITVRRRP